MVRLGLSSLDTRKRFDAFVKQSVFDHSHAAH
jgi:hypothetical protein